MNYYKLKEQIREREVTMFTSPRDPWVIYDEVVRLRKRLRRMETLRTPRK